MPVASARRPGAPLHCSENINKHIYTPREASLFGSSFYVMCCMTCWGQWNKKWRCPPLILFSFFVGCRLYTLPFFILIGELQLHILHQTYFFALPEKITWKRGNLTIQKHTFWNLMSLIFRLYCLVSKQIFFKNVKLNIIFWDFCGVWCFWFVCWLDFCLFLFCFPLSVLFLKEE